MRLEALVGRWLVVSYDLINVRCEFIERPTDTLVHVEAPDEDYSKNFVGASARQPLPAPWWVSSSPRLVASATSSSLPRAPITQP
jgi:hypothetical protein